MNNLKIKNQKSGGTHALFEKIAACQSVSEIVKLSGFERPQKIINLLIKLLQNFLTVSCFPIYVIYISKFLGGSPLHLSAILGVGVAPY